MNRSARISKFSGVVGILEESSKTLSNSSLNLVLRSQISAGWAWAIQSPLARGRRHATGS